MPTFKFADNARIDLSGIVDYTVEHWDAAQAVDFIDGLETVARAIAEAPLMGKACEDLHEGLRGFPCEIHVLYYLEAPHGITIVRVLHKSMNTALHFEKG